MLGLDWLRRERDRGKLRESDVERLDRLERDVKSLRLEWEETYESVRRALAKLGRREKRAMQEEEGPPEIEAPSPDGKAALRILARQRGLMR